MVLTQFSLLFLVLEQYTRTVRPMHIEFVEPSKRQADIIVPVGINSVALSLITDHLRNALKAESENEFRSVVEGGSFCFTFIVMIVLFLLPIFYSFGAVMRKLPLMRRIRGSAALVLRARELAV